MTSYKSLSLFSVACSPSWFQYSFIRRRILVLQKAPPLAGVLETVLNVSVIFVHLLIQKSKEIKPDLVLKHIIGFINWIFPYT